MHEWQSQSHVRWECKYHIIIVPKYRKKVLFGKWRKRIGDVLRELCQQRGVELLEGKAMPDHIHMIWIGIDDRTDQRKASKYFRGHLSDPLAKLGFELQHQPFDHVLSDEERVESTFVNVVEYVARNPERKGLVPPSCFRDYKFTGCLIPG